MCVRSLGRIKGVRACLQKYLIYLVEVSSNEPFWRMCIVHCTLYSRSNLYPDQSDPIVVETTGRVNPALSDHQFYGSAPPTIGVI